MITTMIIFTDNDVDDIKKVVRKERKRWGNDKILDNHFNKGEIEFDHHKSIQVDNTWSNYEINTQETYRKHQLNKLIEDVYINTEWSKCYTKNRKIPKQELSQIYANLKWQIKENSYSKVELFIAIGDFLDVNYKILYEMIAPEFKIELLQELNKEYHKLKEDNIVKLF